MLIVEDMCVGHPPHSITHLSDAWTVSGLFFVVLGVLFRTWAAGVLHKNVSLATSGPYAISRNPLYFGSFLMMSGFCTLIGDWANYLAMVVLALLAYCPTIKSEEVFLAQTFGRAWADYARCTPRLIPRRLFLHGSVADWSLTQWFENKEYKAIAGTGLGLVAIKIWYDITC